QKLAGMYFESGERSFERGDFEGDSRGDQSHALLAERLAADLDGNTGLHLTWSAEMILDRFLVQRYAKAGAQVAQQARQEIPEFRRTGNGGLPVVYLQVEAHSLRVRPMRVHELMLNVSRPDIDHFSMVDAA